MNIERVESKALAGVASIMMLSLHLWAYPSWVTNGIPVNLFGIHSESLIQPLRLCVLVFAFLNGYGFSVGKNKTIKGTLVRILRFLIKYWLVWLCIFFIALCFGYKPNWILELRTMFGLSKGLMIFNWYVLFYIFSLSILLAANKFIEHGLMQQIVFSGISFTTIYILRKILPTSDVLTLLDNSQYYFPFTMLGYIFAKNKLHIKSGVLKVVLLFGGGCGLFIQNQINILGNLLFLPMIIYLFVNLFRLIPQFETIMASIGNHSAAMWFWQCAFFGYTGIYLQKYIFVTSNPFLLLAWSLIILFFFSLALNQLEIKVHLLIKRGVD